MATAKKMTNQQKRAAMLKARATRSATTYPVKLSDVSADLGEEFIAQVREFQMGENAMLFGATEDMSKRIASRTQDYAKAMQKHGIAVENDGSVSEVTMGINALVLSQDEDFQNMVDIVCLTTCVDPQIVESEIEQARNPEAWLLSDFTLGDRMAIFGAAQSKGGSQGKAVDTFPAEAGTDVESLEAESTTEAS